MARLLRVTAAATLFLSSWVVFVCQMKSVGAKCAAGGPSRDADVSCPANCTCNSSVTGVSVECTHQHLTAVPHDLPANTAELRLHGNHITELLNDTLEHCLRLRVVDLSYNKLRNIEPNAFASATSLSRLYLNDNALIYDRIPPSLFANVSHRLSVLQLHGNNWKKSSHYVDAVFANLRHLQMLSIDGFSNMSFGEGFGRLSALTTLYIYSGMREVFNDTFAVFNGSSPIKTLTIKTAVHLCKLAPMSFAHFPRLQLLNLSDNNALHFSRVARAWWGLQFTSIKHLILKNILRIGDSAIEVNEMFFKYLNLTRIETLNIGKNNIVRMAPLLASQLPHLRSFRMSYNRISNIADLINDLWKLKRLRYMDISHQVKRYIFLRRRRSVETTQVDDYDVQNRSSSTLSSTSLITDSFSNEDLIDRLITIWSNDSSADSVEHDDNDGFVNPDDEHTKPACVTPKLLQCMHLRRVIRKHTSLLRLNLRGSLCIPIGPRVVDVKLSESLNVQLSSLPSIVVLGGRHLTRLEYRSNGIESIRGPFIFSEPVSGLRLDLSDNKISCLAPGLFNISYQMGSDVFSLDLSRNDMSGQLEADTNGHTFMYYRNLSVLNLAVNGIKSLPANIFQYTVHLTALNLSGNALRLIEFDFSRLTRLSKLDLSDNLLTNLNRPTLERFSAQFRTCPNLTVGLTGNPIQCSCESLRFLRWMSSNRDRLTDFANISCMFHNRFVPFSRLADVVLVRLDFDCAKDLAVVIAGTLLGLAMVIVAAAAAVYRYRWEIRFWCLRLTERGKQYQRIVDSETQSYDYDAFVVYDSSDRDWVLDELVPRLENCSREDESESSDDDDDDDDVDRQPIGSINAGGDGWQLHLPPPRSRRRRIQLCVHERDFPPGEEIIGNICSRMEKSRRVILVVSSGFCRSNFCGYELNLAKMYSVEQGRNVIVPIMLEMPSVENMNDCLRWIVRKLTYLEWPKQSDDDDAERREFWTKLRDAVVGGDRCDMRWGKPQTRK